MATNDFNPNIAIHPGNTLKELLENINMTQADLAARADLTPKTINEIIQGKNPITPETALKFSAVFGMSPAFWNNLERNYQETLARIERDKKLENELPFLEKFDCYNDLAKWNYISKAKEPKEKVFNLLNFFGVSSLEFVRNTHSVAFRKSKHDNLSHECLAAWLRCGELDGNKIQTKPFDKDKLTNSIDSLRQLTTEKDVSRMQKDLQKICAESGVAVAFVPYFANTFVDGATRWLSADKALIQVSLRGAHIDRFWFTFFHEIGHLLKHGKKEQFVEFEGNKVDLEDKEKEADEFARKTLISDAQFNGFLSGGNVSEDNRIISFAREVNVSPAIVAGRVAHELHKMGVKDAWKKFSHLRSRIKFVQPV
jgi:HTH-type transcriptional regulator / antitoxin HigA